MHRYIELEPDQLEAIDWMQTRTEALCFDPVGFGKTVCMLTVFKKLREIYGPWKMLVFSTKNICNKTWGSELENWDHLEGRFTYASAVGRNLEAVKSEPDILGVNFANLEWYYDLIDSGEAEQREILVIDESSFMKSHDSQRVKRHIGGSIERKATATKKKRTIRYGGYTDRFKRRYALSATPCPETYQHFWAQEASVSRKRRLGETITKFKKRYGSPKWNGFGNEYLFDEEDRQKEIEDRISLISRLPPKKEYLKLPKPIHSLVEVPWTVEAREEYDELERNLEVELSTKENEDLDLDEVEIAVDGAAGLLNKLRQLCSGFAYDEERRIIKTADAGAKLGALEELRDRAGDTPLLVFNQFNAEAEAVAAHFPDAVVGLPDSLDEWNAGEVPMLCVHTGSCGHGLNLQYGSFICVYYSLPWSYEQWFQSWGRLHRRGQTRQVSAIRLERPDSVDALVWEALQAKDSRLSTFLLRMRARLRASRG